MSGNYMMMKNLFSDSFLWNFSGRWSPEEILKSVPLIKMKIVKIFLVFIDRTEVGAGYLHGSITLILQRIKAYQKIY